MERIRTHFDRVGIALSVMCLVQCLLLPVVAVALPTLATNALADAVFHQFLAWVVVPVSLLAFSIGCWRHRHARVLIPGTLGLLAIVIAATAGHQGLGDAGARGLTLVGALLLAFAHWSNYQLCRQQDVCEH